MINTLSGSFQKITASVLLAIFYFSTVFGAIKPAYHIDSANFYTTGPYFNKSGNSGLPQLRNRNAMLNNSKYLLKDLSQTQTKNSENTEKSSPKIGGPSQPEMTAFKSVGVDNMVNLFSGDFSYNIPLLDVGGYPVNIFYDGGVGMEQEASWVGLGWNINPGTVSRNMRGVPDDFNGEERMIQQQNMKPNKTWSVNVGADLELVGIKGSGFGNFSGSIGGNVGISFNNYLGPAIEGTLSGRTTLGIGSKGGSEKSNFSVGGGIGITTSSRSGVTFSPNVSLTATAFGDEKKSSIGFSSKLSTSYNSRTGIRALQLSEQMSFNKNMQAKNDKGVMVDVGNSSGGASLASTSISFAKPSYVPAIRMPLTNSAFSGRFQLGAGIFGLEGDVEAEVSLQSSKVITADQTQRKPLVGYLFLEKAKTDANAVMDFTRFNDNEVTPNTPIISVPQYSYDVFSIQGEGTGGSIRAYRNDIGYVRDNKTGSRDESTGIGGDVGIPGHYGANFNNVKTPTTIGEWSVGNKLKVRAGFEGKYVGQTKENVYFRNPGETSVLTTDQYKNIGGTDLVRFNLGGTNKSPTIETKLERFAKDKTPIGTQSILETPAVEERKKRTQVISFLTAEEASKIGLDVKIKSYDPLNILDAANTLNFESFDRYHTFNNENEAETNYQNKYRRKHHISQINVTEADGQRYVYGIPVYNLVQKDFTFTVDATAGDSENDKIDFNGNDATLASAHLSSGAIKDGYVQITQTPAYAHSFLLSGLLSSDYVDVTNNGITEDDLGNAVKFNYTKMAGQSKWRTPLAIGTVANFNAGKRTETKDDKGIVSYGERESWYMHSIESKTMIALFTLNNTNPREDGMGAEGEFSGIKSIDNTSKRLDRIDLYSKADLKKNGLSGAKPIKTVWFRYSYKLCKNTPNNRTAGDGGKLTLDEIWFTFNGKNRLSKNKYIFAYGSTPNTTPTLNENPQYTFNDSDRWGTYKPKSQNPHGIRNADYPYSVQTKPEADANAGAWLLKKILIPSGGQIEVQYESDDYAFVQNKRAAVMMQVLGFGLTQTDAPTAKLYDVYPTAIQDHNYAFVKVPVACLSNEEVKQKYLSGIEQLSFKLMVKMPGGGTEYFNSYATFGGIAGTDFGVYANDATGKTIWIKLNTANSDGISPLSLTAIEFLREQLPGQAYPGYDVSGDVGLEKVGSMLAGWWDGITSAFKEPVKHLRGKGYASEVIQNACFVRINDPDGFKYGGGHRVKSVRLKDNWQVMNGGTASFTSVYGKEYDYTTTEVFNGVERTISSGVASYEPSLGGDENPFQTMIQVSNKVPLGPASYGAVEMPVLDAFFPAPSVGYSKVTVRSIKKGTPQPNQKAKSGIGKQVTEFFTAKDYPTYYNFTALDPASDKVASSNGGIFFYKFSFDSRAISQGFVVATNDMHGKMKSQASYPENDETTPLNYTRNFYRNTGEFGLDEKFDFVHPSQGGAITQGNMGIDIELMTDAREFTVKGTSFEIQGQLDLFPIFGVAPWFAFIWPVSGTSENYYRAVTTTKVISYHSILDSVLVIDKGSMVSTKNLVYDAETGNVIVNRTNNEYKKPIYSTNYPAYWAYSGMGLAYKNIDVTYEGVNFLDGIASGMSLANIESGDELYISTVSSNNPTTCVPEMISGADVKRIWAFDKVKNTSSLTNISPNIIFIDETGKPYTKNGVNCRIIRSGHRNMLGATAFSATSLENPVSAQNILAVNQLARVVNTSAVEYAEKWRTDNDIIKRMVSIPDAQNCFVETEDCTGIGYLEKSINPYRKGLLGNFRAIQSRVFYEGRNNANPSVPTNITKDGYLVNFTPYWNFNSNGNLLPIASNVTSPWVWNSQVTKVNSRGLEVETKDALNIYTAAQYGYHKSMPVAIANNSRSEEMVYEGFEEKDYDEYINKGAAAPACFKRPVEFTTASGAVVFNTEGPENNSIGLTAHTGKKVLKVNPGTATVPPITIGNTPAHSFDLVTSTKQEGELSTPGGNVDYYFSSPSYAFGYGTYAQNLQTIANNTYFNLGNYGMSATYYLTDDNTGTALQHSISVDYSFYVKINSPGDYPLTVSGSTSGVYQNYPNSSATNTTSANVLNENGELVGSCFSTTSASLIQHTNTSVIKICTPGIYKVLVYGSGTKNETCVNQGCPQTISFQNFNVNFGIPYKTPDVIPSCTYTKPIAGNDNMINPVFNLNTATSQKMLFSAWVREDCSTPCAKETYNNSSVTVGAATLTPSGPIIEGWQRVEGVFVVPAGNGTLNIAFNNSTGAPIYFDDIRIHPYNANMKSYVYDPINLRLNAELDANNYATFYDYDDEGTLVRKKVETKEGIKTITETRSAKQKNIINIQ